jgi:2,4-dienoyl-CoA reductase-like NADH-dependent reductase (Old Yellow Enzyme family)
MADYKKIASLKTPEDFRNYLDELGIDIPFDENIQTGADAPLKKALKFGDKTIGNRFCVLPMEGWDCPGGHPSDLARRRWKNFGISGAKFLWGCEAAAVRKDGMSNTAQLRIAEDTLSEVADMREMMVNAHKERFGNADDLFVGLQLTHSGRFSKPNDDKKLEPKIAYSHPLLNKKFGFPADYPVLSDDEVKAIIKDYIKAAKLASKAGFEFVDVKHCHGYLGHEFLSAVDRPGPYGGSFENRTRFMKEIVAGIQAEVPDMKIGVRLSLFDYVPFKKGPDNVGVPEEFEGDVYPYAFGGDGTGQGIDLAETFMLLDLMESIGVNMVCTTVGSPYYNPHIQRPAMFPPSDGYEPPEDPLVGVARQIKVVSEVKKRKPDMIFIGSAYTYLQEWLGHVAQAVVGNNMADFVGIGRMVLPYPDILADILEGKPLEKKRICRTFSDCTTAPRKGLVSGCYPLDHFYKAMDEFKKLKEMKKNS